ncbi:phage tail sheath C-terminal domain-containing protein [Sphingomonas sp. AOB5]|uniref:phage tail sheath family protein n=1 Tax=Sphingomonas sp. AOB5 TaxID=3034017 RepID=UPI0023F86063|nr:phage tail sheath C-terminal domain-containing protein [Sphingomonas sp. AOB5]MDF7776139.1 phage tail sheath C-terminal domain-containing protein [Sphingomonas sp. AOB5]
MPIQLTYPGVYVQELPSGTHTISGVSTATTAFVGYLRRGPLNTPVQCLNFGDFQRVFGGLDATSPLSFQVSQFFLNGGTEAWVSRLCAASPAPVQPATALPGATSLAAATGAPVLPLQSANPGTWGEDIYVTVDYLSGKPDCFDLSATLYSITANSSQTANSYSAVSTQHVPGVTLDPAQPNSLAEVMESANTNTALLAIPPLDAPAGAIPFASGTLLSFTPSPTPASGVTLAVTVTPPTGSAFSATVAIGSAIATQSDLIAALQQALASAAAQTALPGLASAIVRACTSPFPGAAPLIQIVAPDPALADYRIGVTCSDPALFETLSVNCQAWRLAAPAGATNPDGLPPAGFEVAGNSGKRSGIYALDAMQIVNLIAIPDIAQMSSADYLTAATATLNYAIQRKAFAILDLPASIQTPAQAVTWATNTPASFGNGIISAAAYFPQVAVPSPFSTDPMMLGASGTMAGIYALTDQNRGVWKAPAGIGAPLAGVQQLQYVMNDTENGQINPLGINALRTFPIYDNIVWGARTLASPNVADNDWKYVPVRRLALYLEQSLIQGLQWVVFEPNDEPLWAQIRLAVNSFLHPLYLQGAFVGSTPAQAYQVICDSSTTTATDMDNGIVNILILFAPVKPAEFVVISLQQMAGQTAS